MNAHSSKSLARQLAYLFVLAGGLILLSGCDPKAEPAAKKPLAAQTETAQPTPNLRRYTQDFWHQGDQQLQQAQRALTRLQKSIEAFAQAPQRTTLEQCQSQWLAAHYALLQSRPFVSFGVNNPGLFGSLERLWQNLDGRPIQPGFLDSFDVYLTSGIVNDITLPMNAQSLRQQQGLTSPEDISLGMHVMEYLLWGEHGKRQAKDFIAPSINTESSKLEDQPQIRRLGYLKLLAQLLRDDLDTLIISRNTGPSSDAWALLSAEQQLLAIRTSLAHWLTQDLLLPMQQNTSNTTTVSISEAQIKESPFAQQAHPQLELEQIQQRLSALMVIILKEPQLMQALLPNGAHQVFSQEVKQTQWLINEALSPDQPEFVTDSVSDDLDKNNPDIDSKRLNNIDATFKVAQQHLATATSLLMQQ